MYLRPTDQRRTAKMDKPTKKEIVTSVMKYIKIEERISDGKRQTYSIYHCPKVSRLKKIALLDKKGFQNPYKNLEHCFGLTNAGQGNSIVLKLYEDARKSMLESSGSIWSNFKEMTLSDYEKAVFVYV